MIALRDYQRDVIAEVDAAVDAGKRRVLLVAPTGAGKTVIASEYIRTAVDRRQRILVWAHRRELVSQAQSKLFDRGIDAGVIQAGTEPRPHVPVQLASIQTLHARAVRSRVMDLPEADILIIDEAHHATAATYRRIVESYPEAVIIGLTATPCRSDGRGLGSAFDCIVETPDIASLIGMGYLVTPTVYAPTRPDLTGVQVRQGDYVGSQLEAAMDKPALTGDIVEHYHKHAKGRRTVVFASGVAHSVHLRDEFRRSGVMAEHLDGSTPTEERDGILAMFARGDVEVICNCAILGEGFDCPDIGAIILARPTRSLGLFRQMIGRGLRPAPGKSDALILDHAGSVFTHGLPDDPITWTLYEDRRAENPRQTARSSGRAPTLTECPECKAVRFEGKPCSSCGWRPQPRARAVEVIDGDLGYVDRQRRVKAQDYSSDDRAKFHRQLLWIAREKGYRSGWVGHKYREKFGDWPRDRYAVPEPPDDAVRSWVRSRAIAWAKAQQKAGAR